VGEGGWTERRKRKKKKKEGERKKIPSLPQKVGSENVPAECGVKQGLALMERVDIKKELSVCRFSYTRFSFIPLNSGKLPSS
jgi:hypothetical protein